MTRKTVEIWECQDCGFEMNAIHIDENGAAHTCPCCNESRLENENKRLREALEHVSIIENWTHEVFKLQFIPNKVLYAIERQKWALNKQG